jgi:hypothetical protein
MFFDKSHIKSITSARLFAEGSNLIKNAIITMKKITIRISNRRYLVGFSSSLTSFLESIKEDLENIEEGEWYAKAYHKRQRSFVEYTAEIITENEKCFFSFV